MAKSFHKIANIQIEFDSIKDLKFALNKIADDIGSGYEHDRKKIVNCFVQYETSVMIEPDFRIQEINGQQCMVFQSKMNKQK